MNGPAWPRWWRLLVVGAATIILCSCRSHDQLDPFAQQHATATQPDAGDSARTAPSSQPCLAGNTGDAAPTGSISGPPPLPFQVAGPWAPPGLSQPWPEDEYLRDGGDRGLPSAVARDWRVDGLEPEDTVAHFDTLEGDVVVEPSNTVYIYAPRFAAVRSVTGALLNQQVAAPADTITPLQVVRVDDLQTPESRLQNTQAVNQLGRKRASGFRTKFQDGIMAVTLMAEGFHDSFSGFENISVITHGVFEQADAPRLLEGVQAAITWTHNAAVQVVIEGMPALTVVGDARAQATFHATKIPTSPKLRVIKVASTAFAQPGDTVDFTIRFDNVGDALIGNVTIVDNLTTRLEYVPESGQASIEGQLFTERNEGQSLVLRFEVADPLPPGQGGILRFRCRVR